MGDKIELSAEMLQMIREVQRDIASHYRAANALNGYLFNMLQQTYGVDLDTENWSLDIEKGTLERAHANPTTEQPEG